VIVLYKMDVRPPRGLLKVALIETFEEKATLISKDFRLEDQNVRDESRCNCVCHDVSQVAQANICRSRSSPMGVPVVRVEGHQSNGCAKQFPLGMQS